MIGYVCTLVATIMDEIYPNFMKYKEISLQNTIPPLPSQVNVDIY